MRTGQTRDQVEPEGRDVKQLLGPVRRRWWIVAIVALSIAGATYLHYRDPQLTYTAATNLLMQPSQLDTTLGAGGSTDPDRTLKNQAGLLRTPEVARQVARKLNFDGPPEQLLSLVEATPVAGSDFLRVSATARDPKLAAAVANTFAATFVRIGRGQIRRDAARARAAVERELAHVQPTPNNRAVRQALRSRLESIALLEAFPTQNARQVDRAFAPAKGNAPSPVRNAMFAGVLGLLLGALLVHALEALDRRLPSSLIEAEYGLPLLGTIPANRKAAAQAQRGRRLPAPMVEPVRTVRTTLNHVAHPDQPPRTMLVTSAISGEGKSTLTKSLALGFFESGRDVLVIDADLRNPNMHEFFDVLPGPGLSDVLRGATTLEDAVQAVDVERQGGVALDAWDTFSRGDGPDDAVLWTLDRPPVFLMQAYEGPADIDGAASAAAPFGGHADDEPTPDTTRGADPVLHLLASGNHVADPAALLGSERLRELLAAAAKSYDVVLIDSSPLLAVSDVIPLATAVDGAIVVTRSNFTSRDAAQRFRRAIDRLPRVTTLGLVANGVPTSETPHFHYGGAA